jgi:hypothetical protein
VQKLHMIKESVSNIFVGADQDIKCDNHNSREIDFAYRTATEY